MSTLEYLRYKFKNTKNILHYKINSNIKINSKINQNAVNINTNTHDCIALNSHQ